MVVERGSKTFSKTPLPSSAQLLLTRPSLFPPLFPAFTIDCYIGCAAPASQVHLLLLIFLWATISKSRQENVKGDEREHSSAKKRGRKQREDDAKRCSLSIHGNQRTNENCDGRERKTKKVAEKGKGMKKESFLDLPQHSDLSLSLPLGTLSSFFGRDIYPFAV